MTTTDEPGTWVGRSVRRTEDPPILLGRGRYVDDVTPTRCLHAAFVRSFLAHARVTAVEGDAARAMPGVVAVLTADDLNPHCRPWKGLLDWPGLQSGDQLPMADGVVRFVGEPVAMVVATSAAAAEDAAERVVVDYDELPPVVDPLAALEPGATLVHPHLGSNLAFEGRFGASSDEEVDAAFAAADHVVEVAMTTGRHTATSIEPRGVVAEVDPVSRTLTARISTQAPHLLQSTLAELLGLRESAVRVLTDQVGGAFGMKAHVYPDEVAVCLAALRLGRPVKWAQDRVESLQSDTQARDERVRAAVALDAAGTIVGLRAEIVSDGGAFSVYPRSMVTEGIQVTTIMPGPYRVPVYRGRVRVAITTKAPLAVYRAVGHPVAILVMEALMDEAARTLGLAPDELRRRNLLAPEDLPHTSITGQLYESGSHRQSLETLLERLGPDAVDARRADAASRGRLLGVGLCCFVELSAPGVGFYGARGAPITAHDQVEVRVEPDGSVTVLLGTPGQGQGLHTTAAQVVADALGVPFDRVSVLSGDTRTMPHGTGVWASRSAVVSSGAATAAAAEVRGRVLAIAGHLLEADPDDLAIVDGRVGVVGSPGSALDLAEVARVAYWRTNRLPADAPHSLAAVGEYGGPNVTFNNGAHAAVVEIDEDSGAVELVDYVCVEDCGVLINPDIVDGQIRGGVAQGVGGALLEHLSYDDAGQLTTSTLLDYLLPTGTDLPDIRTTHLESPEPVEPARGEGLRRGRGRGRPGRGAQRGERRPRVAGGPRPAPAHHPGAGAAGPRRRPGRPLARAARRARGARLAVTTSRVSVTA